MVGTYVQAKEIINHHLQGIDKHLLTITLIASDLIVNG